MNETPVWSLAERLVVENAERQRLVRMKGVRAFSLQLPNHPVYPPDPGLGRIDQIGLLNFT
jgi:hypothetical protein